MLAEIESLDSFVVLALFILVDHAYITVPIFGSAKLFQICSENLSFLEGKQIYNTL